MLKIKDNIELKELEKFGFFKNNNNNYYFEFPNNVYDYIEIVDYSREMHIVNLNREKINDVSHFKYVLYKHKVGDTIKVKYYRENKLNETNIILSEAIENE